MERSPISSNPSFDDFADALWGLAAVYQEGGISVSAGCGDPSARARFESTPPHLRTYIVSKVLHDTALFQDVLAQGRPLADNQEAVARFCFRNKVRIPGEALELITADRVIEIYDLTLMQRFRSVNFFTYTSHSLLDLESRPYFDLFRKSPEIEFAIMEKAKGILGGELKDPDYKFVGDHKLWEINSPRKIVTKLRSAVVSPILNADDGTVAGLIHVCEVLDQREFTVIPNEPVPVAEVDPLPDFKSPISPA